MEFDDGRIDAIALLEQQHRAIEGLFDDLADRRREAGDRRGVLLRLADALDGHAVIEEWHFYPGLRRADTTRTIEAGYDDHFELRHAVLNVLDLPVDSPELPQLLGDLETLFLAHVLEEERRVFSRAVALLAPAALCTMADDMKATLVARAARGPGRERLVADLAAAAAPV